jgi:hypothetical protein
VNLAGQPSRVGGAVAAISGWVILVLGLCLAAFLGLLLQSIWPASFVGYAFAVPIAVTSLFFGLGLVFGGSRLKRSGTLAQQGARIDAIRALVAHKGGIVTAAQAAASLNLPEAECDALLTQLAKDPAQNVSLDVDDDGRIQYLFGVPEKRWRVLEEQAAEAEGAADGAERERARRQT